MKALTEKQLDALRWMATNEGVPASGGAAQPSWLNK